LDDAEGERAHAGREQQGAEGVGEERLRLAALAQQPASGHEGGQAP
jgi:hypothetical protein